MKKTNEVDSKLIARAAAALAAAIGFLSGCCGNEAERAGRAAQMISSEWVVSWSHDCTRLTCSNSGTDECDPSHDESVECIWSCGLYQGAPHHVRAVFAFDENGCFQDPEVTIAGCE